MNQNRVHNNLEKFALPSVTFGQFYQMLQSTDSNNTMFIKWRTAISPTHRSSYEFYWIDGPTASTVGGLEASITKEEEGMVNLFSPQLNDWRTVTYDNISSFQYDGKTYTIR